MRALKPAFSLIELLVVVLIIAIVYTLASMQIRTASLEKESITPDQIDKLLAKFDGYAKLVCSSDQCTSCVVVDQHGEVLQDEFALFAETPTVYYFDKHGYLESKKFANESCFVMEKYENGSISNMLFEYKNSFYRYYPLLRTASVYASQDEAMRWFDPANFAPTGFDRFFSKND